MVQYLKKMEDMEDLMRKIEMKIMANKIKLQEEHILEDIMMRLEEEM